MKEDRIQSKSDQTKQYIIEKVAPVFNKQGYAGTSLSDLTSVTGLTKGAIYGNFKNKDEIAVEAFKYNLAIIVNSINIELFCAHSSIEKLQAFTNIYRKIYPKVIQNGGCPILNTATDSDDTHPLLRNLTCKVLNNWKKNIETIIKDGIASGEIKPETSSDMLSGLILSLLEGGLMLSKLTGNKDYFHNSLQQIDHLIENIRS